MPSAIDNGNLPAEEDEEVLVTRWGGDAEKESLDLQFIKVELWREGKTELKSNM